MSPPDSRPTNPTICRLLHCTLPELQQLKRAFKRELQTQWVNGLPFLGQLPSISDPDGAIREELWAEAARKEPLLGTLLCGGRYGGGAVPGDFKQRVEVAKEKIFWDFVAPERRKPKPNRGVRGSTGESEASFQPRQVDDDRFARVRRRTKRDGLERDREDVSSGPSGKVHSPVFVDSSNDDELFESSGEEGAQDMSTLRGSKKRRTSPDKKASPRRESSSC